MRRVIAAVTTVIVLAACSLVVGAVQARADTCSTSGSHTTCKYFEGFMPAYAGGGCCVAYYAYSGYNYWYTNTMWRPVNNWASVFWYNSTGVHGTVSNYGNNPFSTKGSWGYDSGFCENDSGGSFSTATCQVYNWDT